MSRRRGRRRPQFDWSRTVGRSRRRLGRSMLSLGILILLAVIASALVRPDEEVEAPPTATTATATVTRGASSSVLDDVRAASMPLRRAAGGWYVDEPERMPLVTVEEIVDGDTLDVRAGGEVFRVRLFGVNTPERGDECFDEATKALRRLADSEVRLLPDARLQDRSRPPRELRYVFTPDGRSIDAALIHEGYGLAWREDGAYREVLAGIEEARSSQRGCLWPAA